MRAWYNDNDPSCVAWLRELVRTGALPEGDVDARDIADVRADDLDGYDQCHFFAGIGGWAYALRLAGWPDDEPVWTGSAPCQPFSIIGRHRGVNDSRHLWPVWRELVAERRPAIVFGEQVASKAGRDWLAVVRSNLELLAYAVGSADLAAASVGAPHGRPRLYWVADARRAGLERLAGNGDDGDQSGRKPAQPDRSTPATGETRPHAARMDPVSVLRRLPLHDSRGRARRRLSLSPCRGLDSARTGSVWSEDVEYLACADGWRVSQSGVFPLAHGISARVGRLRGYGNAVVPQLAAAFIEAWASIDGTEDDLTTGEIQPRLWD